ncbi:MAG: S8 family serine peptidase [Acidobacteriota bacterium]
MAVFVFALSGPAVFAAPVVNDAKFLVYSTRKNTPITRELVERGGARVLSTYHGTDAQAVAVPESAREVFLRAMAAAGADPRELEDVIQTPRRTIRPGESGLATSAHTSLFLLQYVAPATQEWQAAVTASGVVPVETLPERAVVIVATREQIAALARMPWVQYTGAYVPDYKFAPVGADRGEFYVQIADTAITASAIADIEQRVGGFVTRSSYANLLTARIRADLGTARALLNEPFVLGVETYVPLQPSDERQTWSLTGATSLANANYLNWLSGYGINPTSLTNSGIVVDVADTGVDEGCVVSRPHLDLKGRVVYYTGTVNATSDPKFKPTAPHGTIVAGIIAGNPVAGIDSAGAPTNGLAIKDSDAYGQLYYGLGVAPGVRIGNTVMMAGGQVGSVEDWTRLAVTQRCNTPSSPCPAIPSGPLCRATVQNHSNNEYEPNGASAGYYTITAREFDISVRDADRATQIPLTVTVSAGNIGQVLTDPTTSILAPATAKNVITVGGVESIRQNTAVTSACLTNPGETNPTLRHKAEGYNILAYGSRRGTADNRIKPDLVAPATLVLGPHLWAPASGNYYCAKDGDPAKEYYQQYHGSSGTSWAAPVAAGSVALLRYKYAVVSSPAMYKAMLIAGASSIKGGYDRYTGTTIASWPDAQQGFGRITLDNLFSSSLVRGRKDQTTVLQQSQSVTYKVTVGDPSQPTKIVVAWSDAPGAVQHPGDSGLRALKNDLDLRASLPEGYVYYGNYVSWATGYSAVKGGCGRPLCPSPNDTLNNVEVIHVDPARFSNPSNRTFTLTVTAANLQAPGVPGVGGGVNNQDFALFVVNGSVQQCGTEVSCV